jgi:hypothetical protein
MKFEQKADYAAMTASGKKRMAHAATGAVRQAADEIKTKGRAAIAAGGFSSRWQNALRTKVYPERGESINASALVYHKIPYAGVFQDGKTISGKPLLWLPIEANLPLQGRGKRWTPHDFANNVGPLMSVSRPGKPPLLFGEVRVGQSGGVLALPSSRSQRITRFGKAKKKLLPVFVGVPSITDPQKFDIGAVVRDVAGELQDLFAKNWE